MNLVPLRQIFYDILLSGNEGNDVKANQQMAVSLSNSVRKDGVNIIQLQSVVNNRIIEKVTEGLKYIDTMPVLPEPEPVEEDSNSLEQTIHGCLDKGMSLESFLDHMAGNYCTEAVAVFGANQAKEVLNVRGPKLARLTGGHSGDTD
jgi:hypothetical protein